MLGGTSTDLMKAGFTIFGSPVELTWHKELFCPDDVWWYQIPALMHHLKSEHVITRHTNTIMTCNLSKVAASGPFCNGSVWIPCSILEALRNWIQAVRQQKHKCDISWKWNDLHVQNRGTCIMDVLHVWQAKSGTAHLPLWQLGSSRWTLHFWNVWPQHAFNTVDGRNPRCDVSNLVTNWINHLMMWFFTWFLKHQQYEVSWSAASTLTKAGTSTMDADMGRSDPHLGDSVAWHPATKRTKWSNSNYP